jgi:hypothetical protein
MGVFQKIKIPLTSTENLKATLSENIAPNIMFPRMLTASLEPYDLKE